MGQLRSALSAYLLDGHGPSASLQRLDRFARRVEGALASTAVCLVIDTRSGELSWARAGHPPPLVLSSSGAAYLDDARGSVLGLPDPPRFTEGRTMLSPGSTVLLFTDGLVERRGESIDVGLTRLAAAAAPHAMAAPEQLIQAAMDGALQGTIPTDDVAVIATRLRPGVLQRRLPATPTQLAQLRRDVSAWAAAIPLPDDHTQDLQLALGEAAANAVEHAYAGQMPETFAIRIAHDRDGSIRVTVDDDGKWRPAPADPGFRGRGLAMIRAIGQDVVVDTQGTGTHVRFTIPPLPPDRPREQRGHPLRHRPTVPREPAELRVHRDRSGELRLQLCGELDLNTIGPLRPALLEHIRTSAGPVILDTRDVTYLTSAGVGLLLEAAHAAPGRLQVSTDPDSATAQILALTGLDPHLAGPPLQRSANEQAGPKQD
jgi:anti-anti-sigma factor